MTNRVLPRFRVCDGMLDIALADPQDSLLVETIASATDKQIGYMQVVKKDILVSLRACMRAR